MACWSKLTQSAYLLPTAFGLEEVQNTCLRSSEIADLLHIAGSEFVAAAVS